MLATACSSETGPATTSTNPATTATSPATTTTRGIAESAIDASPGATSTTSRATTTSTTHQDTTTTQLEFAATIRDVSADELAHSYTPDCPVGPGEVVVVELMHWGFDGQAHSGEIVVARQQGEAVANIFRRLFELGYPIESVIPIGKLPEGIEDDDPGYNNTSGLHCRRATGSTRWSEHARGLAIDINPLQNPFITSSILWPANSGRYRDRALGEPGMILAGDEVVTAFEENGWLWGGYWQSIKDYHHFSVTGR